MRSVLFGALGSALLLLSCGESTKSNEFHSRQKKEWNDANDPSLLEDLFRKEKRYTRKYSELEAYKGAKLDRRPWTDYYWPTNVGGLSYRWNDKNSSVKARYSYPLIDKNRISQFDLTRLSPTEKLDVFLGRFDYPYTRMERARTEILSGGASTDEWEGLCHAWAPATLLFEEPGPVTVKGPSGIEVPFGSSDIKGLLVHVLHYSKSKDHFIGTRCDVDLDKLEQDYRRKLISRDYYLEKKEDCAGVNAGAFHIILTNQIGILKEGFSANLDRGLEIWNYPIYQYKTRVVSDRHTRSVDAAPGTVREIEMRTVMHYIEEKPQSWDLNSETGETSEEYHYRIEVDANDDIIGGVWFSKNRPTFAFKDERPSFRGRDYQAIKQIYEASIAAKKVPLRSRITLRSRR